jgi:DNA-directed RNA polymerase specialized sigma24 family protein
VTRRRNLDHVYRYALAISGSATDAVDVTQTTFAEADWAVQARVEPQSRRKWLIDIAHEICRLRYDRGDGAGEPPDCLEGELAVSLNADGRLGRAERRVLSAHLRTCTDCAALRWDIQVQRAAWKELAELTIPASLTALENSTASLPPRRHLIQ